MCVCVWGVDGWTDEPAETNFQPTNHDFFHKESKFKKVDFFFFLGGEGGDRGHSNALMCKYCP